MSSYAYIPLDQVVNDYVIAMQEDDYASNVSDYQLRQYALRDIREFGMDISANIKSTLLDVDEQYGYVEIPCDLLALTKIGQLGADGLVYVFAENKNMNLLKDQPAESVPDYLLGFDSYVFRNFIFESTVGRLYGMGGGQGAGEYRMNWAENRIEISMLSGTTQVVIEYISDEAKSDNVRQGVVVFLGALACHLDAADPKIRQILARLVSVLSTPSEAVQRSVSDGLPPLMKSLNDDERRALIESLLAQVTNGEGYADRRGAAFGLAGAVKGCGISSLKAYGVMDAVKAAVEDKKNPDAREGALMAFELLNLRLDRLFEPYVIHVLPMLLVCFGDQSEHVREATISAARAVMGQLSAQGVKLVLPALMKGLEDNAWRTKRGSVQLMGAMAACAPKQLSACLPQIVPRLSETLIDTHPKVVDAANAALKAIGEVIKNPEIEALSDYLLGAIAKPAELTQPCLDVLLEMTFVNVVDAPSLALIVPVLSRGFAGQTRGSQEKGG